MSGAQPTVVSWLNKGRNDIAEWIKPKMVGRRDANGTFMIHTRVGEDKVQARVLIGHIVIDRKGVLYTCPPAEARALLTELDEKDSRAYASLPKTVGHPHARRAEADVAPRADDTDDISRRIRALDPKSAETLRNSPSNPQKTTVFTPDSKSKELVLPAAAGKPGSTAQKPQKSTTSTRLDDVKSSTPRKWPAAKGNPPSVENRNPAELHLDDSYQRSTDNGASKALIRRIANGWDWRMCLPLVVSKRDDGTLWVIDGQHRLAAAKLRGDIAFLPCCVGVYGSVADEAAMFVAMNRARKPMNRLDDFHAALAGGEPEALQIKQLVTDAGFTVSRKTGSQSWVPGEVAFTSAIAKVLRKHGGEVCASALRTMAEAFPGEVLNAGASMFTALTKLSLNPPEGYDPDRMFRALLTRSQKEWASFLSATKGGGDDRAAQLKEVLLMAYDEVPASEAAG
ncbi:DUF6551 family protein [Novosphingobium sp. HII-3]|uniref:DUF6551 family protein n=1 Tax=Novosphingobium sp. HII-3 TaxID=2075565 RepID=UPI001E320B1F|nr:DUF6551 family protein [Novosphingobium sp. HII-3]